MSDPNTVLQLRECWKKNTICNKLIIMVNFIITNMHLLDLSNALITCQKEIKADYIASLNLKQ